MKYVIPVFLFFTLLVIAKTPLPQETMDYKAEAKRMIYDKYKEHYVSRRDALLMDDHPKLRKALAELAVKDGLMYEYQSSLFEDGFGQAIRALQICRDILEEEEYNSGKIYKIRR